MRAPRLYGLFHVVMVNGRKKYIREFPTLAYRKEQAVRTFQNALLAGAMSGHVRELRPLNKGMFAQ